MIKRGSPENINDLVMLGELWAIEHQQEDFDDEQWLGHVRRYSILVDHACLVFYDYQQAPRGFLLGRVEDVRHAAYCRAVIDYMFIMEEFQEQANLYELYDEFIQWTEAFQPRLVQAPDQYAMADFYQEFFEIRDFTQGVTKQYKGV